MTDEERKALEKYGLIRRDTFSPPANQLARMRQDKKKTTAKKKTEAKKKK